MLDVSDLHVRFPTPAGAVHALRGASIEIGPGEVLGLVGESGSGKSMLGLAALGLLPSPRPDVGGRVLLEGTDMLRASESERRARRGVYVGAVFQDPMSSLNPAMRVGRQVAEAAPGCDAAAVEELLHRAGVPEPERRAQQYPHELSGGLRQRAMIAMAVARTPRLLIADEPTTALDVTTQARVLDLLSELRATQGTSVLLVTHDLGVAAQICDRIAVAYAGRIVECAPAVELLAAPLHPYTLGLLASRPRMHGRRAGRLAALPGRPPDARRPLEGCAFAPRCPAADAGCATAPPPLPRVECHRPGALREWPADRAAVTAPGPGTEDAPALAVRELVVDFRSRRRTLRAVAGVSLDVEGAGSLAIVGESGSGKTTLLRCVAGLLEPTAGTIELGGSSRPQLVFQDAGASLTPWMRVGAVLDERLAAAGVRRADRPARVTAALADVGLDAEVARALPRQLSGGQRQRAAIARAIVVPPALLCCDEPVSALDVSLAAQVLNLLADLRRRRGIALLFVTHDLAVAAAVADEVAVMKEGAVVERGPVATVLAEPAHPYTRQLLAAVPEIEPPGPARAGAVAS